MVRPLRINYEGALHHITIRGNNREKIFLDDSDRIKYLDFLSKYQKQYQFEIYSYVLMENHIHLLMKTNDANLSKIMQCLNTSYTIYFNRKYGRVGHVLQGRFKSLLVEKEPYWLELSRYIHLNPVRAKIVKKAEEYPWSSYPAYLGKVRDEIVNTIPILSMFGRKKEEQYLEYKKFVDSYDCQKTPSWRKEVKDQTYLGGEKFINSLREKVKSREEEPPSVNKNRKIGLERIISEVVKYYGVENQELLLKKRMRQYATLRQVAMYIGRLKSQETLEEIGAQLGGISPPAVARAIKQFEEKIREDTQIEKEIRDILGKVK